MHLFSKYQIATSINYWQSRYRDQHGHSRASVRAEILRPQHIQVQRNNFRTTYQWGKLSMDFLPLPSLPTAPRAQSSQTPHSRHFHSFRQPLFIKHPSPITHIHFCPTKPHRYAVTSSTRVLIYAPKTGKVVKTISRFKDTARSGEFRKDGKLVVAGDEGGNVQVFDVSSRAVLRSMKEHNQSVAPSRLPWRESKSLY